MMQTSAKIVIGLGLAGLITFAIAQNVANGLDSSLVMIGRRLEAKKPNYPNWFRIRFLATDAIEAMGVPATFKPLAWQLDAELKREDFAKAAGTAARMEALMPAVHSTEYPMSHDFKIEWRALVGDLRTMACDYKGAASDYEAALKMKSLLLPNEPEARRQGGKQHAAYGLVFVYGILGRKAEALEQLEAAPSYYWSGCGNCIESENESTNRTRAVLNAVTLPYPEAKRALTKLVGGSYKPTDMKLNGGTKENYVFFARTEAAFALGELSLRHGDLKLAKACFTAVSKDEGSTEGRASRTRLRGLK